MMKMMKSNGPCRFIYMVNNLSFFGVKLESETRMGKVN